MQTLTATQYHADIRLRECLHTAPGGVLPAAKIQSWRRFFEAQFQAAGLSVLTPLEERMLWYHLIQQESGRAVEEYWAFAEEVEAAYHLQQLYLIPLKVIQSITTPERLFFARLVSAFERELALQQRHTFLQALAKVEGDFGPVELYGFVDFPPLYRAVLTRCFSEVIEQDYALKPHFRASVLQAPDALTEFQAALLHIEAQWRANPQQRFALVVNPSVLSPQRVQAHLQRQPFAPPYRLSQRPALVDEPSFLFVEDYFKALVATDLALFSRVLTSPYLGVKPHERALWDQKLREKASRTLAAADFFQHLTQVSAGESLQLPVLATWQTTAEHLPEKASLAGWGQLFAPILTCCGEAGLRIAKTLEALSSAPGSFSLDEALEWLRFVASSSYASVSQNEVPAVHIVGYLEAVDLPVDAVWILGASEAHLPARPKRSAFLSEALLTEYGVPATLEEASRYTRKLLAAIQGERALTVSFVGQEEGLPQALSRLFEPLDQLPLPSRPLQVAPALEWFEDNAAPPMQPAEVIRGGTQILKDQAACPFRAFAHFRLKTKALSPGEDFLSPLQKGLVVHRALELFWGEVHTQAALLAFSETALQKQLSTSISRSLKEASLRLPKQWASLYITLEHERLMQLLTTWLQLEKSRPAFKVIAREASQIVHLAGMLFHVRLDRVDAVGEAQQMVIDYKTGEVHAADWFAPRLNEPQLPLYAIIGEHHAVAYACLKPGKMGFFGVAMDQSLSFANIQKSARPWSDEQHTWCTKLETLAQEFTQGHAAVDPMPGACVYCDLAALCRI